MEHSLLESPIKTSKRAATPRTLPRPLRRLYESSLVDPELLRLDHDLALIETRLSVLICESNFGHNWQAVAHAYERLKQAILEHDGTEHDAAANQLGQAIEDGQAESARWREIITLLETRRRIIDSAMKQQMVAQQFIRPEEVLDTYRLLALTVRRHITDRETLVTIQRDMQQLMGLDKPKESPVEPTEGQA